LARRENGLLLEIKGQRVFWIYDSMCEQTIFYEGTRFSLLMTDLAMVLILIPPRSFIALVDMTPDLAFLYLSILTRKLLSD